MYASYSGCKKNLTLLWRKFIAQKPTQDIIQQSMFQYTFSLDNEIDILPLT